ncbi:MAG: efflux RND transporter periplasmic adaptor subunit [Legionellales bacterium]|nr:efflux RND transporter periplasmic adaptor subunit [Legionellales bacterium]
MSNKLELIKELAKDQKASNHSKTSFKNSKKISKTKIAILTILAIGSLYALFSISSSDKPVKELIETPKVKKAEPAIIADSPASSIKLSSSASILSASGYVVPRRISTIASEIIGKIAEIYIEEGQKVEKGELIAKLDDTLAVTAKNSAIAKVASSKSLVDSLKAKYKKAKFIANSNSKLYKSGSVSQETFIQSQAEAERLQADIAKSKHDVKLAEIAIERQTKIVEQHYLRSPFKGIVTSKDAYPGEIISPASGGGGFTRTGIATIVDMDSLEIEVDVNESNINKVFVEQKVDIILEAYPEKMFQGKVIAIIPSANRDKATIKVRIGFLQKEDIIFPNMAVKINFFSKKNQE